MSRSLPMLFVVLGAMLGATSADHCTAFSNEGTSHCGCCESCPNCDGGCSTCCDEICPAPTVYCSVLRNGLTLGIEAEVCYRVDWEAQKGNRVACFPTLGPATDPNNGCPGDTTRARASLINPIHPACGCTEYRNAAGDIAAANMGGRMCKKMGTSTCYPMLTDHDATKGDNDNYYGCPVDMLACVAETAPTVAPTDAPTAAPTCGEYTNDCVVNGLDYSSTGTNGGACQHDDGAGYCLCGDCVDCGLPCAT